jgi:CRP-like cAMP-binding protein
MVGNKPAQGANGTPQAANSIRHAPLGRPENEDISALGKCDLFRKLTSRQLTLVAQMGQVVEFRQGEVLGVAGHTAEALYFLLEGQVQLLAPAPSGYFTVRLAGGGESLPLAALVGEGTLITSAVAATDGRAFTIQRDDFLRLCDEHPDIGCAAFKVVADVLARRYRETLERLIEKQDAEALLAGDWANM